jgi:uncharacterized protein (DUF302 family)
MEYTINRRITDRQFEEVERDVRTALAAQGFGVLTEIDVKSTLKNKIGAEIEPYRILGACNPGMAHEALKIEPRVGAMLPCNVIIRQLTDGVEVSAIDPVASMAAIDNATLKDVAAKVRSLLADAVMAV